MEKCILTLLNIKTPSLQARMYMLNFIHASNPTEVGGSIYMLTIKYMHKRVHNWG